MGINGIVLLGAPGSGKSSIGKALADRLKMVYVSSGDIARKLAIFDKLTSSNLSKGDMANEVLMRSSIHSTLYDINYHNAEFVLDGFPRNTAQLIWLRQRFPKLQYCYIDCPEYKCVERMMDRKRDGETRTVIMNRFEYYNQRTKLMIDDLDSLSELIKVDGNNTIESAVDDILIWLRAAAMIGGR